jgi:PKHD-type hydroxylase
MIGLRNYDYIVYFDEFLNDDEIALIEEYVSNMPEGRGEIGLGNQAAGVNTEVRDSIVKWIEPVKEIDWLNKKIVDLIFRANNNFFHMELSECSNIQHSTYHAPSGCYHTHVDTFLNVSLPRKISFTVQLSDESDYEGGDVLIYHNSISHPYKCSRKKGAAVVFFSMFLHQVTPITSGTRQSLVGWVSGPHLK